jgi:probable HAF family extracellular repeat protein
MEVAMTLRILTSALAAAILAACASNAPLPGTQTVGSAAPAYGSEQYTVVNLGTLGGASSGASSINNRAWISGLSSLPGSSSYIHAALWQRNEKITDLGTLGGPNSAVEWPVKNNSGLISGISETAAPQKLGEIWSCAAAFFAPPPSGHICRGFAWQNGTMTQLPTLGGNNGFAAGANDSGLVVGWAENDTQDSTCTPPQVLQFEAVVYDPQRGTIHELPPYAGDLDGAATEINDAGTVIGISGICDQAVGRFTARHAVMWQNGKAIDLGSLGGVAWNTPMAINNRGEIVGFADLPGDSNGVANPVAFRWTRSSGMQSLGTLSGDTNSEALGINDRGQIVGISFNAQTGASRAFLWQNGTMIDLNTLIGANPSLYLLFANDIDDRGEIAGGACVLVSDACSSAAPAFAAIPSQGGTHAHRASAPARPVRLSEAIRRMLERREHML